MNFATKIFLSIVTVAILTCVIIATSLYTFTKNNIELEFNKRYKAYGNMIASIFHYLELSSDLANKNAVMLLSMIVEKNGIPNDVKLDILAKEFGVNGFYIIDKSGKFLRSSDLPIQKQVNSLFTYSDDYRSLLTGNYKIATTPIIPSYPYDVPAKLTMIPNHDNTLILESSTHLEYISKILNQIMTSDKYIKSAGLYAPTGYELGSISSSGKFNQGRRNIIKDFSKDQIIVQGKSIYSIKVPSVISNCPECIQKGVSTNGQYYYILQMEVSRYPLYQQLSKLKSEILMIFTIILIISIIISKMLSKKLVSRIKTITHTANNIIEHKNLDLQVKIKGNDEIQHLANTFNNMITALKQSQDSIIEAEKIRSVAMVSARLAHDIRSPLVAIDMILSTLTDTNPEKISILKRAVKSINDIANSHLTDFRKKTALSDHIDDGNLPRYVLLTPLIEIVIAQKQLEWEENTCKLSFIEKPPLSTTWVNVAPNEIKRILSNLLNNAFEAIKSGGEITIKLSLIDNRLQLHIEDNGHGIPDNRIKDVMCGMSLKHEGKGLGLSTAKEYMESIGGSLLVNSNADAGTKISLYFPDTTKLSCLANHIDLANKTQIVLLDDDMNIHNLWRNLHYRNNLPLYHCATGNQLIEWHQKNKEIKNVVFLIDYELNDEKYNGLMLIDLLSIAGSSYLITSRAEEFYTQQQCEKKGIKLMPKSLLGDVKIIAG